MATDTEQQSTPRETAPYRYTAVMADEIETRWQAWWEEHDTFHTANPGEAGFDASRPKYYCLDMFPYPSGSGLHVGHPEGYTATDIICRYKRMQGFNVLHPMGWDAFGLPAEQYAIQTGVHPVVTTRTAIDTFRRQLKRFGFGYDWSREFGTIDEDYYRWTQWIFLQVYHAWFDVAQQKARPIAELVAEFASGARAVKLNPQAAEYAGAGDMPGGTEAGAWDEIDAETQRMVIDSYRLAYVGLQTVNWCPKLGTALANEEVIDGRSERGGFPVLRKPMRQWMFRITAYADRLLDALADVDWPQSTKTQQARWIGRSEGAEIDFTVLEGSSPLRGDSSSSFSSTPPLSEASISSIQALLEDRGYKSLHPIGFQARDPYPEGKAGPVSDLLRFDRNPPHLRLSGATYFVSWKAADGIEFDSGECDAVLDALRHFDDERCRVYAAVVMSNHVHWIVRPFDGYSLDELVTSIKRFTAKVVNEGRSRSGHVWHAEQFDHIVRDAEHFAKFVEYVMQNPVEAGVVVRAEDYRWVFVHRESVGGGEEGVVPEGRSTQGIAPERRTTLVPTGQSLRVFTTRPDTIFGATYMVVAPEHPLVDEAIDAAVPGADEEKLRGYVEEARNRSDVERMEAKEKTGCFTGMYVRNPATGEPMEVWTSDYVLMGYGTGAIMAVPAHDDRDFAFATALGLPIRVVVIPEGGAAPEGTPSEVMTGTGVNVSSANKEVSLDGLSTAEAKRTIIAWLEEKQLGMRFINYRLRDWLFSRQRYWGEPFPIVWDAQGRHHAVGEETLPVKLPEMADYVPVESDDPQPLLGKATDWVRTTAGEAGVAGLDSDTPMTRETNTMPGWAGSCWYFLRYCDPKNSERLVGEEAERYWMEGGVDLYVGGAEHAVLHLLYARFWHKVLFDLGHVSTDEPFRKLFHQGLITSHAYQAADKSLVPVDEVCELQYDEDNGGGDAGVCNPDTGQRLMSVDAPSLPNHVYEALREKGSLFVRFGPNCDPESWKMTDVEIVTPIVAKMSKSLKNVVNPDDVIEEYGADTFRLYEMYMGPLEASKPWNTTDTIGLFRFLQRAWRLVIDVETGELVLREEADEAVEKQLHRTIAKVTEDIERLAFNTAIAAMIQFVNTATGSGGLTRDQLDRFCRILSAFSPHMGEEMWHRLGHEGSVVDAAWPGFDESMLRDDEVEIVVQLMGKVKAKLMVPADADAGALEALALADAKVQAMLAGKTVRKVIAVPGRLVNIVAN